MFGKTEKGQAAIERTSFAAGSRKGQAAMEYLMTYGWAILVIVIVLAILAFYLPSFIRPPEDCIFSQPGFACNVKKPVIVSDSSDNRVYLLFRIDNQQGSSVDVKRARCTTEAVGDIQKSSDDILSTAQTIPAGGSREFGRVYCYDSSGEGALVMAPNSNFRGTLAIWYNFEDEVTDAPERLATATVTGTVLAE